MSIGSALGTLYAGRRIGLRNYNPSRATIRNLLEHRAGGDVERLYRPNPYEGSDLGYSPRTLQARLGEGGDSFAAARAGDEQRITDLYRRASGGGALPGAFFRSMQGARQAELGRRAGHLRDVLISDEEQRRQDLLNRLEQAKSLGFGLAGQRNLAEARRYAEAVRSREMTGEGIGDFIGSVSTFGVGGGGGSVVSRSTHPSSRWAS